MAGAERRCPRKAKYKGNVMESQEQRAADSPNAGDEPNPATQSIDVAEVARADVRPSGAAASKHPPQIPLAPMKRMQARFNPLADGLMYLVVFVGGFVGVGFRRATDLLLPSVNGSPFVVGTFVSNMLACFLFAMLTEYMATASWLRRRVRQVVSRGVGLGLLGGLSTMSGVMLETMEGMREQRFGSALGYLAGSFAGGLIAAAVGVALMQALLARGTRKRVRNAIADASTASVSSMSDSGESDELRALATANASTLSTLISAPVALHRVSVYPIANYGSAMAPFYTILSIWVGAIILCAMLKVTISDREKAHVLGLGDTLPRIAGPSGPGNASRWGLRLDHEYFGRYAIFALLALLQGTLVCLGDTYFLGVQANHALQFLAVGWLAALVFSNIVYTLTVSFGDIGKAVAVVLLVMQVAGSGGTFPIETLPKFFQMLYPFLPFPHAIDAMHAAMAGSYGNEYLLDMVYLALFLIPSLLLGLVLRKPVIRLNNWVSHNLESTKVM